MRFRKTHEEDIQALTALWQEAFGDEEAEIAAFFSGVYPTAYGFAAEEDGKIVSMLFAIPQTVFAAETAKKAAYIYAVATGKEWRKKGLATKLLKFAEKELQKRYIDLLYLMPAGADLVSFYEKLGYIAQKSVKRETVPAPKADGDCEPCAVQDYAGMRETILMDTPHIQYAKSWLDYENGGCHFYLLQRGNKFGCAAAWVKDGKGQVSELLPDETMLPALSACVRAESFSYTVPGSTDSGAWVKWLSKPEKLCMPLYAPFYGE